MAAKERAIDRRFGGKVVDNSYVYQINKTAKVGGVAEKLIDVWCIQHDVECARPIVENNPVWDRLVRMDGEWKTVQIKETAKAGMMSQELPAPCVDWLTHVNTSDGMVLVSSL